MWVSAALGIGRCDGRPWMVGNNDAAMKPPQTDEGKIPPPLFVGRNYFLTSPLT